MWVSSHGGPTASGAAGPRRTGALWVALTAAALPALLDAGAIARAAALHALADQPNPYFQPAHAWLLYAWAPAVAISACVLFLSPGLLIALALGCARDVCRWVLCALALSIVIVSVSAGTVQAVLDAPMRGPRFGWLVAAVSTVCAILTALAASRRKGLQWPALDRQAGWAAATMVAVPFALLAILAPKFYWEVFNGDGAHAFEVARLLLVQPLPFFPPAAGPISSFPGITSMLFAFPSSWFIRLFGELEVSARLPLLLYLPVLFAAIVTVAQAGRVTVLGAVEQSLIWLAVVIYAIAVAFSATYDPYAADIALPATQDTLLLICFLGFVLMFIEGSRGWMPLFIALTYTSLPSGLILIGFWLAAVVLIARPRPWRLAFRTAGVLAGCVVAGALLTRLLIAAGLPAPGGEYGLVGLLRYFAFLQFTDLTRLLYVMIPSGILPIIALLAVWRQDSIARAISLVTLAYFSFFYVQANVSLHHFVPAMLLPIVVLWRVVPAGDGRDRRIWIGAAAATASLALALALPANAAVDTSARHVGRTIEDRVGGYQQSAADQLAAAMILGRLFPPGWDPSVPDGAYGGSPLAWNYYASRGADSTPSQEIGANYVLQRHGTPAPAAARLAAGNDGVDLYVRSDEVWRRHLALRPATPAGSRWLAVPRSTLFRSVPSIGGPRVFDVATILERLGLDVNGVLSRLGVSR